MITFNTRHSIDDTDLEKALEKLVAAYLRLGVPLVITDTWFLDGRRHPSMVAQTII